jgi:uncharacterized protein
MDFRAHLRGHLLRFDVRSSARHGAPASGRLLLAAIALEGVRLAAIAWLPPSVPLWVLLPLLLALALLAIPALAGLKLSDVGLLRWRYWTLTEKSYFLQVVLLASIVFPLVLLAPLRNRFAESGAAAMLSGAFLPYLAYGFYQEVVYRGMLQRELGRRHGALTGILVASVLYAFGPLHWNHYAAPLSQAAPMFAAIFAIGLYFGLLYARSGNLWLGAVFHAIGNAFIVSSLVPASSGAG